MTATRGASETACAHPVHPAFPVKVPNR